MLEQLILLLKQSVMAFYDALDHFENPVNPSFSRQIENRDATTILSFEHLSLFRPPLRFMFRLWRCHDPAAFCAPSGRKMKEHRIHEEHRIRPRQDREPLLFAIPPFSSATRFDLNPLNSVTVLTPTKYAETQISIEIKKWGQILLLRAVCCTIDSEQRVKRYENFRGSSKSNCFTGLGPLSQKSGFGGNYDGKADSPFGSSIGRRAKANAEGETLSNGFNSDSNKTRDEDVQHDPSKYSSSKVQTGQQLPAWKRRRLGPFNSA